MKCFAILVVLIGVIGTAYAESQIMLTPFDVYLSSDNFTAQGPNHNILALDRGESATLVVHVKNNDDKPHQITLKDPRGPDLGLFETFRFEPEQITVMPHQTNSTQLYLTISNDTHTHSSFVTFLGQSATFGMKGLGFFVVVDREIDEYVDKSLRSGLPGGAFPHLNTEISESEAEKSIGSGFGIPKYLPSGYEFRGMDGSEDQQRFVYSPANIDTESTGFSEFWNDGGLLIIYSVDGPNVNNTKSLPVRVAQDEGQQIMINGMMGDAIEKQTRVVAESDITYDVPASVIFFDDAKKKSAHLRANMPLDELLKIASSIPIYDGSGFTVENNISQQQGQMDYSSPRSSDIPPLKQFKSGIAVDKIQCRESLNLVIKHDGSPACVKEQTVLKLIERGWIFDPANNTLKQCAIEYDRIMRIPGCPSSGDGPVCEPKPLIAKFIEPSDEIANFKKMHCADNVDDWSHLTEHEEGPDNGQIDWKLVSGIHHENPTFDVYGLNEKFQPIKVGREIISTIQYWDIVSCFDAETRIVDKLTKEVVFENTYTYECKDEEVGTFDKMMLRITDDVNWKIKLPGFYVLEIESEKINLTEEFFVECTSSGCEFLTDEQLEGRKTYRFD